MISRGSPGIVDRVRKLLRLAQSSNPHEAESASAQAHALMVKHGLTEDDVAEEAIELLDQEADAPREWLAVLVASLFGCSVVVHKREGIGLRGIASKVEKARTLYKRALDEMLCSRMPPVAPWLEKEAAIVWRYCWWQGFKAVVTSSFAPAPMPSVSPPKRSAAASARRSVTEVETPASQPQPRPEQSTSSFVEEVVRNVQQLDRSISIAWFQKEAYAAGRASGERVASTALQVGLPPRSSSSEMRS